MYLSLVVATADNNAIGKDNHLPWCLPNDMKFFKNITWAMVVIMGRKTLESLGKPLKGRKNIVITRQTGWEREGVVTANSLERAIDAAAKMDVKEAFVIGGSEIYKLALPKASRIYLTRVHTSPADADAFFPEFNRSEWQLISNKDYPVDNKHAYAYSFQVWQKKEPL